MTMSSGDFTRANHLDLVISPPCWRASYPWEQQMAKTIMPLHEFSLVLVAMTEYSSYWTGGEGATPFSMDSSGQQSTQIYRASSRWEDIFPCLELDCFIISSTALGDGRGLEIEVKILFCNKFLFGWEVDWRSYLVHVVAQEIERCHEEARALPQLDMLKQILGTKQRTVMPCVDNWSIHGRVKWDGFPILAQVRLVPD